MRGNSLFHSCRPILDIFRVTVLKLRYITDANGSRERTFMSYADHNISNLRLKVCIKPLPTFVVSVGKFPANYFGFSGVVRFKGITFILYLNYTWHLIWTWNVKKLYSLFLLHLFVFHLKNSRRDQGDKIQRHFKDFLASTRSVRSR